MQKTINHYLERRSELNALEDEFKATENSKIELGERRTKLVTERTRILETLHDVKVSYARGKASFEDVQELTDKSNKLALEVETIEGLIEELGPVLRDLMRQIKRRADTVHHEYQCCFDAITQSLTRKIQLQTNLVRAYAAAKLGHTPPRSFGRWIDGAIGEPPIEGFQDEFETKYFTDEQKDKDEAKAA